MYRQYSSSSSDGSTHTTHNTILALLRPHNFPVAESETRSDETVIFSDGLRLGFRWQKAYIAGKATLFPLQLSKSSPPLPTTPDWAATKQRQGH